jgi:aminomethyltransferase
MFCDIRRPFFFWEETMGSRTPLYDAHVARGAKMVDFGGWDMPINYGSQIEEHHQVRRDCGMFDVSHMTVLDLHGARVREYLKHLLANNVDRLKEPGKALYSCMLNEHGGVIDDLIVYFMSDSWFRMVVNAATRDKDVAWIRTQAQPFGIEIRERTDLAMIAVQGPNARAHAHKVLGPTAEAVLRDIGVFFAREVDGYFVARTGYTGEDGYEIMVPATQAVTFWNRLIEVGAKPCGLGARDTLRLEAGMNLYGSDMDENTSPLEAGLSWTIGWDPPSRNFTGRNAIERQRGTAHKRFVGLVLADKGVLRNHQKVFIAGKEAGEITSGGFSPTLGRAIAFARIDAGGATEVDVDMRGKMMRATVVKPPFVRNGKSCLPEGA